MVLLHLSLYEVHLDLLKRSINFADNDTPANPRIQAGFNNLNNGDFELDQDPSHRLKLADDVILSKGKDTIVGDSATLYFQVDSARESFEFVEVDQTMAENLIPVLDAIVNRRQHDLDNQIPDISVRLSDREISALFFADVPFYISVGNDNMNLHDNEILAIGDFATLGIVFSDDKNPTDLPCPGNCLRPYIQSVDNIRKRPSVSSFLPRLSLYETDFFFQRFDQKMAMKVEPVYHGDVFNARSSSNIVFGDYLNAATLGFIDGDGGIKNVYVYGTYENYEW